MPTNRDQIRLVLAPLRAAGVARQPNQPMSQYEQQAAELEKKAPAAWTTTDRINLGACYLRMNRPNDAIRVLSEADQKNPFVLANLAAAYQGINELRGAVEKETDALAVWPSIQAGWTGGQLAWDRRVEGYYLKLLKWRLNEPKPVKGMDLLFGAPNGPANTRSRSCRGSCGTTCRRTPTRSSPSCSSGPLMTIVFTGNWVNC